MSMSTYVRGIVPPDETWQKMKAVWETCEAAGIPVPGEVERFFGGEKPDPAGVVIKIEVRPYKADMEEGFEVDLAALPPHVKTIRFWNRW
jgi:hypothetical protein